MNEISDKRRFAAEYLRRFDAQAAAEAVGKSDGVAMLQSPAVQRELRLQRGQIEILRCDALRRLAQLAFGRANDCVRLVLEESPNIAALDLSLLSELKRSEKGAVEVKLLDRVAALERLLETDSENNAYADAFFSAAAEDVTGA